MPDNKRAHGGGDDDGYHQRQQKRQHYDGPREYDRQRRDASHGHARRNHYHDPVNHQPSPLPQPLPSLPSISSEYASAPFTHRSTINESRSVSGAKHASYERLEFLGDAYIEEFATELIFDKFQHLSAGQMSQLRELLVKNETLADYSRAYGFHKRLAVSDMEQMKSDAHKRNKGYNKVLGDVFEAYIAAVALSHTDREKGKAIAREWLLSLWAPKVEDAIKKDRNYNSDIQQPDDSATDLAHKYNPDAKGLLQKRIMKGSNVTLSYEKWKDSIELRGDKLGQNRHFVALYLTGYGYEKKLLGRAEGKNKVEAGNWCAIQAMYGDGKAIIDECEQLARRDKEERRGERLNEKRMLETQQNGRREMDRSASDGEIESSDV